MAEEVGLKFGEEGPSLDGVQLTRRTRKGQQPADQEILERELLAFAGLAAPDLFRRLDAVCRAMNLGDFATAAIATEHAVRDVERKRSALMKASSDDPKHPGWPAGAPDGKGGQFRPEGETASESRGAKIKRLAARRGLRSTLRRILTFKRVARIVGEVLGDAIPGIDAASGAASLIDAVKFGEEAAADAADTEAAIAFVEKGPQALEDLQVSAKPESFPSYSAFKKSDLNKRFGPAGDGYEYHHIVEQGPNASNLSAQDLNATTNIIRIPRLLHEEINSYCASPRPIDGKLIALRDHLRGKPFSDQFEYGVRALRDVGAVR